MKNGNHREMKNGNQREREKSNFFRCKNIWAREGKSITNSILVPCVDATATEAGTSPLYNAVLQESNGAAKRDDGAR